MPLEYVGFEIEQVRGAPIRIEYWRGRHPDGPAAREGEDVWTAECPVARLLGCAHSKDAAKAKLLAKLDHEIHAMMTNAADASPEARMG